MDNFEEMEITMSKFASVPIDEKRTIKIAKMLLKNYYGIDVDKYDKHDLAEIIRELVIVSRLLDETPS